MKKLKSIKQQYKKEEQAFSKIRKIYVELTLMSDKEILGYFDLSSKEGLIAFAAQLQLKIPEPGDRAVSAERDLFCICTDTNGIEKELYQTKSEAETVSTLRRKESGEKLLVYACPAVKGWHLTRG